MVNWPTIVQPIVLEETVTTEVYQTEDNVPLLRVEFASLDCAVWITVDTAELLGNVAKQVRQEFEHDHIQ